MCSDVNFQSTCATVTLSADWALEGLHSCMNQLMSLKMAFRDESFSAVLIVTDKGSLTCVNPQMRLQISSLVKFPQTFNIWTV